MRRCSLCNRKNIDGYTRIWALQHLGYKNLDLCLECDLSVMEQIFEVMKWKATNLKLWNVIGDKNEK